MACRELLGSHGLAARPNETCRLPLLPTDLVLEKHFGHLSDWHAVYCAHEPMAAMVDAVDAVIGLLRLERLIVPQFSPDQNTAQNLPPLAIRVPREEDDLDDDLVSAADPRVLRRPERSVDLTLDLS